MRFKICQHVPKMRTKCSIIHISLYCKTHAIHPQLQVDSFPTYIGGLQSFHYLLAICKILKVTPDELLGYESIDRKETVTGEKDIWKFREREKTFFTYKEQSEYELPEGYILFIRPEDSTNRPPLIYNQQWRYLPLSTSGQPVYYWIYKNIA